MSRELRLKCSDLWKVYGSKAELRLRELQKRHESAESLAVALGNEGLIVAVGGVSFEIPVGEIFIIMGLSGSGKSTLVRCLSRLIDASAGHVYLDGEDLLGMSPRDLIEVRRRKMGMVFQHFGLMPHLSVLDNVGLPLKMQGQERKVWKARAMEMIRLVGLDGRQDAFPRQLSGGQQQRVGIARSLAIDPELWFLDEPFSALDPLIRRQMQDEFLGLQRKLSKTIVFITHDFQEAVRLGDRIAIMRDGTIVQLGAPADLVLEPVDDYVASFTEDVPLTKILCARDIMQDGSAGDDAPTVAADALLEDVIRSFSAETESIAVTTADGSPAGVIHLRSIVDALGKG